MKVGQVFYREYSPERFTLVSTYVDPRGRVAATDARGMLVLTPVEGLKRLP